MSHRRELSRRLASLTDIGGILSAMKSLALLETRVLGERLETQRRMVAGIEAAAADLLACWPELTPLPSDCCELCVVVGSEQGFCGDFNEALLEAVGTLCPDAAPDGRLIAVGQRLAAKLDGTMQRALSLPGATVADEVPAVLLRLTQAIGDLLATGDLAARGLSAIYHGHASAGIRRRRLLPLRDLPPPARRAPYPPDLNLPPAQLLAGLSQQYLYAVLNEVVYSSLLAENRQRLTHMERALDRLEDETTHLRLACNAERQEEIIEEIEVILLSFEGVTSGLGHRPGYP